MRKKTILLSLVVVAMTQTTNAQTLEWAKQMGGTGIDNGYSIATDGLGNVYTTGVFRGTVDFDPGAGTFNLTSAGSDDIFISKLDASGNFVWAKQMGGTNVDQGRSIVVDASGNVYTTGLFSLTADFDPGTGAFNLTSAGNNDVFISKLDASGNFVWAKQMGGTSADQGFSIALDASGNIYTAGRFVLTADFDPGASTFNLTSAGSDDIFISKLDASGNFVWAKQMGGTSSDYANSIIIDASGDILITGFFTGTADFDPGVGIFNLTSAGLTDIFISKLDAAGNFVWAKQLSGTGSDNGLAIAMDASGNIYTTGSFDGTTDFDPGVGIFNLTSAGSNDIFISKLDAAGNFVWAKQLGGTGYDVGSFIAIDASGNVYTTGLFQGTVDFDPGAGTFNLTSTGSNAVFISKLDAAGNFMSALRLDGSGSSYGFSIAVDSFGNVYTTGSFRGTVNFDPGVGTLNLTSVGIDDIFVHKISQCVNTTSTDIISSCTPITWIDGITYSASTTTPTFTIVGGSSQGCDSIVTLNLTINSAVSGIDVISSCTPITWIDGITYSASTTTPTFTIVGGAANSCDSVVTLNLTINSVSDITTINSGATITANNTNATYKWLDCDNAFAIIPNETAQNFTATVIGSYAVELTENGCVDTSNCVLITTVGIIENIFGSEVKLYPNPSTGAATLIFGDPLNQATLSIVEITGKEVYSLSAINSDKVDLNIHHLSNGIYFIKVNSDGKKVVIKLIKE